MITAFTAIKENSVYKFTAKNTARWNEPAEYEYRVNGRVCTAEAYNKALAWFKENRVK